MKALVSCVIILSLLLASCSPKVSPAASAKTEAAKPAKSYLGNWDVTITGTPMGDFAGVLTIRETDGKLSGNLASNGQNFKLTETSADAGGLSTSFYYPEAQVNVDMKLLGAPGADVLAGKTMGEYMTVAKRKL